jgi:hypothetical protein
MAAAVRLFKLYRYPESPPGESSAAAYEAGLRRTVKLLTDAGKRVVYVKSNPLAIMYLTNTSLFSPQIQVLGWKLPVLEVGLLLHCSL